MENLILDGVLEIPKLVKVYGRYYDNPVNRNDLKKVNKFLGEYTIIEQLSNAKIDDVWDIRRIGIKEDKLYLITGSEVTGLYSGIRYSVHEIKSLQIKQIKQSKKKQISKIDTFTMWVSEDDYQLINIHDIDVKSYESTFNMIDTFPGNYILLEDTFKNREFEKLIDSL